MWHGFNSSGVLKLSATPWPFCVEPVSALTRELLYCCSLWFIFSWISSVAISRWQGFKLWLLKGTSDFHCFGAHGGWWSRARSPDLAIFLGLAHGRDYSFCMASEQIYSAKVTGRLVHCFSLNCRKYLKYKGPRWGIFNPKPQTQATGIHYHMTSYIPKPSWYDFSYALFSHMNKKSQYHLPTDFHWIVHWAWLRTFKEISVCLLLPKYWCRVYFKEGASSGHQRF